MDTDMKPGEAPLWKDEVKHILSSAVYHSFKTEKVAMIDHHNLIDMFWKWYNEEMLSRKYCPVNWKWVIVSTMAGSVFYNLFFSSLPCTHEKTHHQSLPCLHPPHPLISD